MGGLLEEDHHRGADEIISVQLGTTTLPTDLAILRRRVRELLVGYPEHIVTDAVLVADALGSNAADHGEPPHVVRLMLLSGGACLRIEADDASVFALPVARGWSGSSGLGMLIISNLATSWGVERHPSRKTVWAEVELVTERHLR